MCFKCLFVLRGVRSDAAPGAAGCALGPFEWILPLEACGMPEEQ